MLKSILLNGQATQQIDIQDRGLQYGDGLFETLRVQDSRVPLWNRHWQRLKKGCLRLAIPLPEQDLLLEEVHSLIAGEEQAVLKLIITRGKGERGYASPTTLLPSRILMLSDGPDYPPAYRKSGIRLYTCETRLGINPALAGIKHLNRLEQVLARNEWQSPDYQEGLLLDTQGHVMEGTMSNIFWVKAQQLYTADLSHCGVEGVMREIVMEIAKENGISLNIGLWSKSVLLDADEIFVTNSLIGIWPVSYIFNMTLPAGPVTQQLQSMLQAKYDI